MKALYLLLIVFLLVGTAEPQKQRLPNFVIPQPQEEVTPEKKGTDSAKKDYFKAVNESNKQNDLLILEKKKADKENVYLKKENARLRLLISNKPDTVFFKQASFFRRWFPKRKSKKTTDIILKKDALP